MSFNDEKKRLRIALVSDFFCPNTGGVETHIYHLGAYLLELGHYVIVITHDYGERRNIRYLSNGLKVYHVPFFCLPAGLALPSVWGSLFWYRKIYLVEQINLVHGHSSFSTMAHESLVHAWAMGIPTVFTDHSLHGFSEISACLLNKLLLRYSLSHVHQVICVSHTSKENTVLRAGLRPEVVSVIPNAINASLFQPGPSSPCNHSPTIVVLSRLVYRKGADLLVEVIPETCKRHPNVRFIICGDGPKRVAIEEMRERENLHLRVEMLGMLCHSDVRQALIRGQIFLNTSLTEAFCMAVVEAASCGLHVVSTRVGGLPEVLPDKYITLVEPHSADLVEALLTAISRYERNEFLPARLIHDNIAKMYRWKDVAERTVKVYRAARKTRSETKKSLINLWKAGKCFSVVWIVGAIFNLILLSLYDFFDKRELYEQNTMKLYMQAKFESDLSISSKKCVKTTRDVRHYRRIKHFDATLSTHRPTTVP